MSLASFAKGLNQGIPTGINLGNAVLSGRNARGVQQAQEVLAEMQEMGPIPVTPSNSALPEEGSNTAEDGIPVGYDGLAWDSQKRRYFEAMKGISDPQILKVMEDRLVELEQGKVMQYGRSAMAALDAGDVATAQQYFAGMSYFMNPGETPVIQMSEDGVLYVQDSDFNTQVFTKDQIAELMHQFTDFKGWRQMTFDKQRHSDMMQHRADTLAYQVKRDAEARSLDVRRIEATEQRNQLLNAKTMQDMAIAREAANRADELHAANLDKAEYEKFTQARDEAFETFDSILDDPDALSDIGGGVPEVDDLAPSDQQALPTDSQLKTEALGQAAREDATEAQAETSALRNMLRADPMKRIVANTLMSGLVAGGSVSSGREAGSLAFGYTFEGEGQDNYVYDPQNGTLNVGGMVYRIGDLQARALAGLLGAAPAPPSIAPGNPPGIAETGATP